MAKSAEAKAEAQAAKAEAKAAAQAAKAESKAEKAAAKAEQSQLKSAQRAEITALKSVGASKSERVAEQKANRAELNALKAAQASGTYTPRTDAPNIRSAADTYANSPYAPTVQGLLNSAAENYQNYNIVPISKRGDTTIGVGLDKLVDYQLGQTGSKFNTLMDRAKTYVGQSFSPADLESRGVKLKEDKQNPNLYYWSTGAGGGKEITYFSKNPDGTYTGSGINRVRTEGGDKGFFDSALGKIALGIGGFYLGPLAGGLLELSGSTAGLVGGGLLGGAANVLGGGKFLPGALAGGMGGFTGGGGLDFLPSVSDLAQYVTGPTQPGAPIYDAMTGQFVSGGEVVPSALTGTGQNLGSFGQLGSAMPFNPADISLAPTIPGAEMQLGTAGYGTALRAAPALAADLTAAGFAPGTAANLAGLTSAGTGATNLLGGATALAPVASGLSWMDQIRGMIPKGINILGQSGVSPLDIARLMQQPQQPEQQGGAGYAGASPDYNALIAALSAPRVQPKALV